MKFVNQLIRLKYWTGTQVVDAGPARFEEDWYDDWLAGMVGSGEEADFIFFFMVETTDVFEEETKIDYNTVVYKSGTGHVVHTYEPECPEGCYGQLDDCKYKIPLEESIRVVNEFELHSISLDREPNAFGYGIEAYPVTVGAFCNGESDCPADFHANDCPKWEE